MNQGQIQEFLFGGLSCNTSVRLGSASAFFSSHFLLFFLFFARICWLWETIFTVMNSVYTVYVLKNIKNGYHDTIYTFKNYFATVFSIFSFKFSATINSIQTDLCISNLYTDWNDVHHDMTQLLDVFLRTRLIDIFFETVPFNF